MIDPTDVEVYAADLRSYLAAEVPASWRTRPSAVSHERLLAFERGLYATRWFGAWLPTPIGGRNLPWAYRIAFERELAAAGVPDRIARVGQNMLLPALLEFGTDEQRQRHIPDLLAARTLWCQGFSEPGAGSDLASLRCRGIRVDGGLVVRGQKVWTSLAHLADHCFCLVRTDDRGPKHQGITLVLLPMRAEGIEVRPIRQIDGRREFSEVFFDDVFVPESEIVGTMGDGWRVAMHVLQHERSTANVARQTRFLAELSRLGQLFSDDIAADPILLDEFGSSVLDAEVLTRFAESLIALERDGESMVAAGTRSKLYWSEAHQRLTRRGRWHAEHARTGGQLSADEHDFWRTLYLASRAETIYAGTSEIQRNIIAQRILSLPRS